MSSISSSPRRSVRFSARALCFCLCISLLLIPSLSFAESLNDFLDNTEMSLLAILSYSKKLEEELQNSQNLSAQQRQQIEMLLSELSELKTRLEISRSLLARYKSRVDELLSSIGQLEVKLKQLSETYAATEAAWNKSLAAAEKEIRVRKIKTVLWIVGVAVGSGAVGYMIGRMSK